LHLIDIPVTIRTKKFNKKENKMLRKKIVGKFSLHL